MNKETKNNITLSFSQKVHTKANDPSTASPQNVRIMETWLKRSVLFILVTMYLASTLPFHILIVWYLKWNKKILNVNYVNVITYLVLLLTYVITYVITYINICYLCVLFLMWIITYLMWIFFFCECFEIVAGMNSLHFFKKCRVHLM